MRAAQTTDIRRAVLTARSRPRPASVLRGARPRADAAPAPDVQPAARPPRGRRRLSDRRRARLDRRRGLTLVELLTATAITCLLMVTLATFAEAVSVMWHEGEDMAGVNQQLRVALTHLRREIGQALYVSCPPSQPDTLAMWAHDDAPPYGEMNLSEIVIICSQYNTRDGHARLVRVEQQMPGFWNFSYPPDQLQDLLSDWGLVGLLKYWWYARPATLADRLPYDSTCVRFATRTTPAPTAYDPSATDRFVDFQLRVELNPTQGTGAGSTHAESLTIDGSAQAKNHQHWLDS